MKPLNEELEKKKIIAEKYNSTSNFYDDRYKEIQNGKFIIQFKQTNFQHKTLLDAGCGTGLLFEYLSRRFESRECRKLKFVGIDLSWKMLLLFSDKTKELKNITNTNLILGDLENLPFRNDCFNMVSSITSLQNLQDLQQGLNELCRVGKDNGDLQLSVLRKQLKLEEFLSYLNSRAVNLKTTVLEELEDVIIQGKISKAGSKPQFE
ncbi:MAG: class I SAM-dependent methyltransferase [Promethearchaeota archaeon]